MPKQATTPDKDRLELVIDLAHTMDRSEVPRAIEHLVSSHIGTAQSREYVLLLRSLLSFEEHVEALSGDFTQIRGSIQEVAQQAVTEATARRAIMDEEVLDSTAVAQALGSRGNNQRETASTLRRANALLGLPRGRRAFVYPAFQFDLTVHQVRPVVEQVNRLLMAGQDPWGAASWWVTPTPRLNNQRPVDLVGSEREDDLLILARAEAHADQAAG